jgi:hypothetical protein
MSSLINTRWKNLKSHVVLVVALGVWSAGSAPAQEVGLRAPASAVAGNAATIGTIGSGNATFYLNGPSISVKRDVQLGQDIPLAASELQSAGRYVATACAGECTSIGFFVAPAKPSSMTFLVHPSRAPVSQNDVISGVAIPFDEFHNMVLAPETVHFQWVAKNSNPTSHSAQTRDGIAWFRTGSGKTVGALQVVASINDLTAKRVVQQVASDPCGLRIKGQPTSKGIIVETEPVRDCSGNPVPDGTIVTFSAKNGNETSFVDAPVKQDVARATLLVKGPVVVSAASGVAMGNELRLNGKD